MKRIHVVSLLLVLCALAVTGAAQTSSSPPPAQGPAATGGAVYRVNEYRFKPGANNARDYTKFLREHRVPILTEQKQQGLILDFKYFHNDATAGPNEVQFVEVVVYRNYNDALDSGSNEERAKKLREIVTKHYGSLDNMQKTVEPTQNWVEVVRGYVLHEMTFTPVKPAALSGN